MIESRDPHRKIWRIQVIAQVEAYRPDGRTVSQAGADGVRHVIKVAGNVGGEVLAVLPGILRDLDEARPHVLCRVVNVSHIVEQYRGQVLADEWERKRRSSQFDLVDEDRFSAQRKTRLQVPRTGLVECETAQGVSSAREKTFGQRNEIEIPVR